MLFAGILASLIGIENFWYTVSVDGLLQYSSHQRGIHRIGESPGQHGPGVPVYDGGQIQEASLEGNIGDIPTPDLIGMFDDDLFFFIMEPFEDIGVDFMLFGFDTGGLDFLCSRTKWSWGCRW
jgi:hypothetical protein